MYILIVQDALRDALSSLSLIRKDDAIT